MEIVRAPMDETPAPAPPLPPLVGLGAAGDRASASELIRFAKRCGGSSISLRPASVQYGVSGWRL